MPAIRNILAEAHEDADAEVFTTLLEHPRARIERIVSTGQKTPAGEWYDQAWDEWVLLLEGSARLSFAGVAEPVALGRGDYLLIPAHQRHRVEWTAAGVRTVWLAVHLAE